MFENWVIEISYIVAYKHQEFKSYYRAFKKGFIGLTSS